MNSLKTSRTANFEVATAKASRFESRMSPIRTVRTTTKRDAGTHSRPPLARMLQLHQQIQAGQFPNCRKLANALEVSSKTIQRDIDFMRDRLGLPIAYDQLHFGFVYTEPVTHFPRIEVSEGEIVALFVAQKALEQYKGTSFEKPLRTAFEKIIEELKDRMDSNGAMWIPHFRFAGSAPASQTLSLSRWSAVQSSTRTNSPSNTRNSAARGTNPGEFRHTTSVA